MKLFKGTLLFINLISMLGLIACYASGYISPYHYWYISLLSLGYFIWLGLNLLMIGIWICIKWKWAIPGAVVVLAGFSYHLQMIGFHPGKTGPAEKENIKILSYNIQLFKYYDWKKNEKERDRIISFIEKTEADVYCFQEYFQTSDEEFATTGKLKKLLPGYYMHFEAGVVKNNTQEYGLATFSRYPIVNKGMIVIDSVKNRTNLVIYTDVLTGADTTRIYNVHLASNHLNTNEVDSMMNTSEKSFFFAKKWIKKLKNGYKRRYNQVNLLEEHTRECKYPVIIAGDFNDTPGSYTYRKMHKKYADAFIEGGSGIGATYNGNLPLLRIDYIFYSKQFRCRNFKVHKLNITDHFPVVAELERK